MEKQSKKQQIEAARRELKAYWGAYLDVEDTDLKELAYNEDYKKLCSRSAIAAQVANACLHTAMSIGPVIDGKSRDFFRKNREELGNYFLDMIERSI